MSSKSKSAKPDTETNIYNEYFSYTKHHKSLYGDKTIVLMQVGAFFEVYGVKDSQTGLTSHSNIIEFGDICQLNISEKKASFANGVIVMAGFRDYTIDKYISKLSDAGYTIPLYIQEKNGKEITRKLSQVYSSGTYISCDTDSSPQITNNIMCIWMDTFKPFTKSVNMRETIVYGVSVVNIFTGKSSMFQYENQFYMNATTFDELERYVSIFSPSEVVILSPFDDKIIKNIMQLTGLNPTMIHKISINGISDNTASPDNQSLQQVSRCMNQKYIKQILSTFFGDEVFDVCSEFRTHNMATQSYCYLLNFIQEHNPDLVRKISIPEFNNTSSRMILANHTLSQLNIINDATVDSKKSGKLSCVLSFLNKCCSPMGKRRFQSQLLNPTFDEDWLNAEYKTISFILNDHYYLVDLWRAKLFHMRDIEKICRQLIMKKVYPSSVFYLYNTIKNIQQMNVCLFELPQLCDYLCDDFSDIREPDISSYDFIDNACNNVLGFLDNYLFIDNCKSISSMFNFEVNIIRPGISAPLDAAIAKYNENLEQFSKIQKYFNSLMQKNTQDNNADDMDYIKVHETDKSGNCLQITTRRSLIMKNILATLIQNNTLIIKLDPNLHIPINDIKFTKSTASTMEIEFPLLNQICKELLTGKEFINSLINEAYLTMLIKFEKEFYSKLENIAAFVSKIDILQAKTYVAKTNNYCCPIIHSDAHKSFVNARELRHCLIEHLQQNEIYVTNDITLKHDGDQSRDNKHGILLFGTNAVGKTSLIRALGVAVIMAQSGMFVPSSQFVFKPYTAIFSRILGNDNLFKGLSTFAVEMTELRIILKMADENSLILGDELCSGTETESALSIFVAGLMNLHAKQSSFIFATHFHEIVNYDEITSLHGLSMKHMAVAFDREQDCLIYDRKLKDGSGPKTYGLEVCKSLYLGDEFLDAAYAIRNKYYPETRGNLSLKTTTYNQDKIRGMCEICGKTMGEEIHHLAPQRDADENGFIGTFHKNHKANLVSICEICHDKIHDNEHEAGSQLSRKKTTKGYKVCAV
jgi:DNA mismatch repair protein MutS